MADDEQFSLCWNNFNTNLSAGFHESLCRGDLVDVTLAAEGQFVKAHRLVLSVCSPYFRKMFTQMPSNQHAFVFLKDVSHTALKDLIQFMYCGEVNVKQEALPAFISTAEALQIKGLTDSDPPSAPPASQQTQQQQQATEAVTVPAPQITQLHNTSAPARTRHRTTATTTRTYKLEAVDADDDDHHQTQTTTKVPQTTQIVIQTSAPSTSTQQVHQIVQGGAAVQQINAVAAPTTTASSSSAATAVTATQKRTLRASGGPHLKRTKNSSTTTSTSVDPLETANDATTSQTQQNTVQAAIVTTGGSSTSKNQQVAEDTEYIDLPLEIPTKSEPDYNEEAGEAEGGEADGTYGEDDYAEMRYDETYFTENEDGNVTGGNSTSATTSKTVIKQQPQSSFSDSSFAAAGDAGDQPNNDAQEAEVLNAKTTAKPLRKRGRPKLHGDTPPQEKLMDKLASACRRTPGVPTVYASTTKGAMKVIYEGHHFRYSFRKGQFSIFQCCYKENKEECRVRVVSDQKRVYPLDGEHTHFVQATDKSVTSVSFEPGEPDEKEVMDDVSEATAVAEPKDNLSGYDVEQYMLAISDEEDCADVVMDEQKQPDVALINPNDFREKIKKRLQKALLGKKK